MKIENKLLGYWNYTVLLTYIGMLSGFLGITYAFEQDFGKAVVALMVAGFCDMFDGRIASTMDRTRQEKAFGIQIDSLSDLICFGVLPGTIAYGMNRAMGFFSLTICSLYVLSALVRLAYFNVDEEERQLRSLEAREIYYGMPVTLSALFLPLFYAVLEAFSLGSNWILCLLVLQSVLFLLPIPLRKPKWKGKSFLVVCGVMEIAFVTSVNLRVVEVLS